MPTLSEHDSMALLAAGGVRCAAERRVADPDGAVAAADELGYPVALKLCGDAITHKTERGLVRLGLASASAVERAGHELLDATGPDDGAVSLLVAEMVAGSRELIVGTTVDEQFGPTVMLGLGGVLAEAVADVTFRLLPITEADAYDMIDGIGAQSLLGEVRGEPAVDRSLLAGTLLAVAEVAADVGRISSIDVNPLVVSDGAPIAVDALVVTTS